ncbi:Maf family protein [Dongia deserti]|uniref:Maf family protein n=1 Tax=Dongia deserti TaxID=2268030 RepID=UPI000E6583B5|nr:nucleoside triphosphate pyrophosphatase [Dongia deserti]
MPDVDPLILASGSATRAKMLRDAGVAIETAVPAVDEAEIKASLKQEGALAARVAETLAELKAQRVSSRVGGRFVLGCDQMLECDRAWLDKPETRDGAREQLKTLRGKDHSLITSAVLVHDGARIWHVTDRAELRMRNFTDAFLEQYLEQAGEGVLRSVGAYQLEGIGAQLFERVTGDFFTILGLPLLPVLGILREHSMVAR